MIEFKWVEQQIDNWINRNQKYFVWINKEKIKF